MRVIKKIFRKKEIGVSIKGFFKKEEEGEVVELELEEEKEKEVEEEKEEEKLLLQDKELQKKNLQEKCPHDKEFISEEFINETKYGSYAVCGCGRYPNPDSKVVTLHCKRTCQICGRTNLVYLGRSEEQIELHEYLYEKLDGYSISSRYNGCEYLDEQTNVDTYGFLSKIPVGVLRTKAETNELLETIKIQKEKEKEKEREEKLREEQEKAEKAREEAKKRQEKIDLIRKTILEE